MSIAVLRDSLDPFYSQMYAHTFYLLGNKDKALTYQGRALDLAIAAKNDDEDIKSMREELAKIKRMKG